MSLSRDFETLSDKRLAGALNRIGDDASDAGMWKDAELLWEAAARIGAEVKDGGPMTCSRCGDTHICPAAE